MNQEKRLAEIRQLLSKHRVLVVEDDDKARSLYCEALQREGFLVDGARNLQEALSQLEARTYHVAVVDIMLAGEHDRSNRDGLTVLQAIKDARIEILSGSGKIVTGTRLIPLTGQDEPQLAAEMRGEYGANDYIDKGKYPFTITDELTSRVQRQVKECKISLYGDRSVPSFLAGPGNESVWVDRSLRMLKVKGGYIGLERFFSALCDPIGPLMPQRGAQAPTVVDEEMGIIIGRLWSKALALPISLLAGRGELVKSLLQSKQSPDWEPDNLLVRHSGQDLTGFIFELKNVARSEFEPHLP